MLLLEDIDWIVEKSLFRFLRLNSVRCDMG
jgi:hypothetical protein